jgi:hypothetical protein
MNWLPRLLSSAVLPKNGAIREGSTQAVMRGEKEVDSFVERETKRV